ncbi:MAG: DUF4175 family protein [Thermoguttaceae bacterium]
MIAVAPPPKEPGPSGAELARRQAVLVDRVEETRRQCHRFLFLRAAVWTILTALIVGGLLALADDLWVLSRTIRQANWILAAAAVAALVLWRIVRSRRKAINRLDTAAEIETAFPDLGQRVCTTLEYAEPTPSTMPAWPSLVRALTTDTEERTGRLDFMEVIPWRRLRLPTLAAALLVAGFLVAIAVWPSARIAALRLFLIPVHYTQLTVEPGDQSVKFGHDVTIRATISGRPVTKAELHLRKAGSDDSWSDVSLAPEDSQPAPLVGKLEKSLKNCRENVDYRATAGEVESETYRLTILHPLLLRKIEASIEPPAYTRKQPSTTNEGDFEAIEGAAVRFRFELDRPAQTAWLRFIPTGKGAESARPLPLVPMSIDGKNLAGTLENATRDLDYEINAEAADGMKLDPQKFRVTVQPDRKPMLHFVKPAVVIEALPTTEVTIQLEATDDFGLTKVGIVYQIGDGPKETLRLDENPQQPVSLTSLATLYLEKYKLNYQDAVVYYAFAEDNYPAGPHRVTSDLQFIDIRPYKRTFALGKPPQGKPGESIFLEKLISKQRTNLQHTFVQCGEAKVDDRIAKRIAKAEDKLAKQTEGFAAALAERVGRIPCLEEAVESMRAAVSELGKKSMKPACGKEELALAQLIQARQNLRLLLIDPKTGGETERLDYQAEKNTPDKPKQEKDEEEEEEKDENLQKQITELAKTERDTADELEGKSVPASSNSQSPNDNAKPPPSQSQQPQSGQSQQSGQPQQQSQPPQQGQPSQPGRPSQSEPGKLAERQQRAAEKAAELAKKMQSDEAMTDLAKERMANAERSIRSSADSLDRGEKGNAGQQAREAAAELERLAKQVGALKAAELAEKLQAAESIARQAAQQQRDAEKGQESGESGKSQQENESSNESGEGGDGAGGSRSTRSANRQRTQAEDVRTAEDILNEAQSDAKLTDPDLARALEKAAAENSPKEIAAEIERAAKALSAGEREQAKREIRDSARRLDALADRIEEVRHGLTEPKLEALLAAEKQAAELQKKLREAVSEDEKNEIEKKMGDLRTALGPLRGTDPNLQREANALSDAIENGASGRVVWARFRQGYFVPPELYASAIQRVDRALQVRIQELILKDAILDQDQPVPEQYRRRVEEYLRTLSEDLR